MPIGSRKFSRIDEPDPERSSVGPSVAVTANRPLWSKVMRIWVVLLVEVDGPQVSNDGSPFLNHVAIEADILGSSQMISWVLWSAHRASTDVACGVPPRTATGRHRSVSAITARTYGKVS